jgi:hypothetical protein
VEDIQLGLVVSSNFRAREEFLSQAESGEKPGSEVCHDHANEIIVALRSTNKELSIGRQTIGENMSVNQPPKKEVNESIFGWQSYLLWFVAVLAAVLIILPLLPGLISNLAYSFHSFGGKAPKIYWYLSRAAGFVSFTILWVSMALGLGITNKLVRVWPGAPSAFAVHQFTSLLGLAFAAYHGLVLMGDHFVDFSLPRLLIPFSIAYETFWIGLGQVCFYVWLAVVLSFYIRQRIGQKTWRLLHYVNFVVYVMGFMHGIKSGTDSDVPWVSGYFWTSAAILVALLVYRIYDTSSKKLKISLPRIKLPTFRFGRSKWAVDATSVSPTRPSIATRVRNLPQALLRAQAKRSLAREMAEAQVLEPVSMQTAQETPAAPAAPEVEIAQPLAVHEPTEGPGPATSEVSVPVSMSEGKPVAAEANEQPRSPVIKLEGLAQGKKTRIRIFGEPTTRPIPELQDSDEIKFPEYLSLLVKLKNRFRGMPVEPSAPKRQPERIGFSED